MSFKIVAPVVVNPETLSKNASVMFGIVPEKIYGSAPKILVNVQASATTTKPALVLSRVECFFPVNKKTAPSAQLQIMGIKNGKITEYSLQKIAVKMGIIKLVPTIAKIKKTILKIK